MLVHTHGACRMLCKNAAAVLEPDWSKKGLSDCMERCDKRLNLALHVKTQTDMQHQHRDVHHPSHKCT